jgi:hypothetical protein
MNKHSKVVIFPAVYAGRFIKLGTQIIPKKVDNQTLFMNGIEEGHLPRITFNPNSSAVDQGFFDEWFCK